MSAANLYDPLGFNMEEVIAALPTQQERDEYTLFVEEHLKRGVGAGILRGMFLLLKANRCYLEKLPGQFNRELVQPVRDLFLRLEKSLAVQIEAQKQIAAQNERTAVKSFTIMERMDSLVPKIETAVQDAVDRIDTGAITQQITDTVLESTVKPITQLNQELARTFPEMERRSKTVLGHMEKMTWYNIKLFFLNCASFWGIIFFCLYGYGYYDLNNWYEKRLAAKYEQIDANAQVNHEAYAKLTQLNVTISVVPQNDAQGNVIPGHYAVVMKGADNAGMQTRNDGSAGAILFQGHDFGTTIDLILKKDREYLGH